MDCSHGGGVGGDGVGNGDFAEVNTITSFRG